MNKLDLTIFHDTKTNQSKLNALSKAFAQDCFVMDNNLESEIDFVTVSKYSIVLTEVKSKVGDGKKAFSQLRDAENLVKTILQIVGLQDLKVPVLKVIASPDIDVKELHEKAKKSNVILLDITEKSIECTLSKIFSYGDSPRELNLENFVAALAFLQSCPTFQSEDLQEDNLKKSILEGSKGMEIVEELKCHQHLKNWNHPESKERCVSRNIFIWLDPIQSFIMCQPNPCQIITGPASTGKTILVQLKVLELMKNNHTEDVLVILPSSKLKEKYEEFFVKHNFGINHEKLVILTYAELIQQTIPKKYPHIFIDEFCASSERSDEFCKIFETLIKHHSNNPRKLFWITADFKQNQSCLWDIPKEKKIKILNLKGFSKNYLSLIHRCTANVLQEYIDFCGSVLDLTAKDYGLKNGMLEYFTDLYYTVMQRLNLTSHQHKGQPTKIIRPVYQSGEDVILTWAKSIHATIQEEEAKGWSKEDIAVIVVAHNQDEVLLYLKLKSEGSCNKQIFFEQETLSLEFPVVIVCVSTEDLIKTIYIAFSRAIFKLIIVLMPQKNLLQASTDYLMKFLRKPEECSEKPILKILNELLAPNLLP